jgi:hypothetical protein
MFGDDDGFASVALKSTCTSAKNVLWHPVLDRYFPTLYTQLVISAMPFLRWPINILLLAAICSQLSSSQRHRFTPCQVPINRSKYHRDTSLYSEDPSGLSHTHVHTQPQAEIPVCAAPALMNIHPPDIHCLGTLPYMVTSPSFSCFT